MKKLISFCFQMACIFGLFLVMNSSALAYDNVVVVPLGGAVGDATQGDVLQGKSYSSGEGKGLTGSMVDNSALTLTPGTAAQQIPQGYHDGNGMCEGDSDLVAANIPAGLTLFGVTGTLTQQFTANGDGTVTDNLSGLMWEKTDDGNTYNWYEAAGVYNLTNNPGTVDVCGSSSTGSYLDWRLPTKDELKGLVRCSEGPPTPLDDFATCGAGYSSPTIALQFSCRSNYYWSSSEYDADRAWLLNFSTGYAHWVTRTYTYYVRCVR